MKFSDFITLNDVRKLETSLRHHVSVKQSQEVDITRSIQHFEANVPPEYEEFPKILGVNPEIRSVRRVILVCS